MIGRAGKTGRAEQAAPAHLPCLTPDWPAPPHVHARVTVRDGGVSEGAWASLNLGDHVGDDPAHVRRNRARLRAALALPTEPRWLRQVHGTGIVDFDGEATERDAAPTADGTVPAAGDTEPTVGHAVPTADGAVTGRAGVVCVVMTADCLPVLLCDRRGRRIGVAHAGWRGLAAGVLDEAVAAMRVPPPELHAWLGPAISAPAYEVGDEVRAAFSAIERDAGFTPNARGRWQADLVGLARMRLTRLGVSSLHGGSICTFTDPRFFSHRREAPCGRMATLIWLQRGSD